MSELCTMSSMRESERTPQTAPGSRGSAFSCLGRGNCMDADLMRTIGFAQRNMLVGVCLAADERADLGWLSGTAMERMSAWPG